MHCPNCPTWGLCWRDLRCLGSVTPAPEPTPEPEAAPVTPARKKSVKKPLTHV